MAKMKRLLEQICDRNVELDEVLKQAETKRPEFYAMVCITPSRCTVKSLLRGITDDETLIQLVSGYLNFIKKS